MSRLNLIRISAVAALIVLSLASPAFAQISTATVKGKVTSGAGAVPVGTTVSAVNKSSGFAYRAVTKTDGSYVLTNVPPGEYEITVTGADGATKTEELTLAVGEAASIDLALGTPAEKTEEIVVTAAPRRKGVKNSEVGTSVPRKMVEAVPQGSRNFLASADLAPGVGFVQDQNTGYTQLRGGAQNQDNVNVFVDGVSQKNNILRGGVTGQDGSRGNPFPQSAVAEYKVITQNYKAEYDQVSSAAITAVTKSGSNDLHGDLYLNRTETEWRSRSPMERVNEEKGQPLPFSGKNEFGASVGGPIVKDVLNYFVAYDGKDINDSRQVLPQHLDRLPLGQGVVPQLASKDGNFVDPFEEHLLFTKLNGRLGEDRRLSASFKMRLETDRVPEDRKFSTAANRKDRNNDEYRFDVLHEWNLGTDWLSETRAGYQHATWNPHGLADGPFMKYKVANSATVQKRDSSEDVIFDGGSPDKQKRQQSGFTVGQDVTYTGLLGTVLKGGLKVGAMKYDLSGTSRAVDIVEVLVDRNDGHIYYDGTNCLGTIHTGEPTEAPSTNPDESDQCKISRALPPASVSINNVQLGLYVQDDWTLGNLELNVGVRWDYETNMLNNDYATPADRVAALFAEDGRNVDGIVAPAGQTYAESLRKGGINIEDYIADGKSRDSYKYAFAPRLGASYDVFGDKATVVFGGYGRSYDRAMANHALDEKQKNSQAGGEIWLIRNDFEMPYTDQLSLGVRQGLLGWNLELTVSELLGKNQFQWFGGNRDPNGGWANQPAFDPLWGGPRGYGTLILGDFIGETRAFSTMFRAEKPYSKASPWTVSIAYTYTDAETKHNDWNDDIFDWTYGKPNRAWHPSNLVDKHRVVAAGMLDDVLPWGVVVSGKYTFGDGRPRKVTACPTGWGAACQTGGVLTNLDNSPIFSQLDFGLAKIFKAGPGAFTLRADFLNVLNRTNYLLNPNQWGGGPPGVGQPANEVGGDNLDLNKRDTLRGPMRTLILTGNYTF